MFFKGFLTLIFGFALASCNGSGPFLSPAPTKPIKKTTTGATIERTGPSSDNGNSNQTNNNNSSSNTDQSTTADDPLAVDPVLDCFDNEIPASLALVDGHADLFLTNGAPSSICALLTSTQRDTAIIQYIPATCVNCEQAIQNTRWAIERSGYQDKFLHVLALPNAGAALEAQIQEYIDAASIPATIITDTGSQLANELLGGEIDIGQPSFYTINSLLEVDYIAEDDALYLEIVPKAEAALLSVDASEEVTPMLPQTEWDGLENKESGLIDIRSVTDIVNTGAVNGL